eukprot:120823_1
MSLSFITNLVILVTIATQLKSVTSRGWVRPNNTYVPLDICMFDAFRDISFYFTCYHHQLHFVKRTGTACNGSQLVDELRNHLHHDCDVANIYNDYLEYTLWDLNIMDQNAQCSNKLNYNRPDSQAQIINKCLYEPQYNLYKMDTCTDTVWTTSRYSDDNCQNLEYIDHLIEECKENHTFVEITTCTAKMNSIGDRFGYIQYQKDSILRPLDKCITVSRTYSYLYSCHNNNPYVYIWSDSSCGSVSTAEIHPALPFSFSCSLNPFDHATLHVYNNNDNCGALDTQRKHRSFPVVVNQCYNVFDASNTMVSAITHCDNTSLWSVQYDSPDCDERNGSSVGTNITEVCSNNNSERYIIDCVISGLLFSDSTTTSPTTTTPTMTTIIGTPAPTSRNKRIIYVTSDGNNSSDCWFLGIGCGTFWHASTVANWQIEYFNLTEIEIVIQGQNPIEIEESLQRSSTDNPCLPHTDNVLSTRFQSITYTFDPNYIRSMSDWYNATLCENLEEKWRLPLKEPLYDHFFGSGEFGFILYTFIINNLIIESYSFEGRLNQPYYIATLNAFICNHCVFRNILIHSTHHDREYYGIDVFSTLIVAAHVECFNCIIDNITYIPSSSENSTSSSWDVDKYDYDHSFITISDSIKTLGGLSEIHSLYLSISDNTRVSNINGLSSVIYILGGIYMSEFDFYGLIDNVTFDTIYVVDAIIYNNPVVEMLTWSPFNIGNTNFFNIDHGSILYSEDGRTEITISNVYITTSQTINEYFDVQNSIGRD